VVVQANKKLFLSAVSGEFGAHRRLLAGDLKRPTLEVAVQEDFLVGGGTTLQKLDDYIKACDGVVHLIGEAAGAVPEAVAVRELLTSYPDFGERLPSLADGLKQADPGFSYTQWEAYLAIYHKRPVFIYRPIDFAGNGKSQHEHFRRISALGRDRGQFLNEERLSSAVLRDLVEILPRLASRIEVPPTKLRHTAEVLIGRDEELTMLDAAWNDAHRNVVVVRGKGGEGKTSLVASWMAELAMKDWRGAEWVFDWSFYSQGTRDQSTASAETFIHAALGFFGDADPNLGGPEERGARLAKLAGARRGLLVLDGLEPLQYPPGPMHGQLTDRGMAALLRGLAGRNDGLCVVTTREKVDEVKQHYGKSAVDHALEFLSPAAGAALLHHAGARRAGAVVIAADDEELRRASVEVRGHALTLFLVGQYLKLTEHGDIRRRDRMKLADAEAEYKNDATRLYGHAFKAIEAYETWFAAGDGQAKRQLAILRLLGLFDRPASKGCLEALRAKPKIAGLNDALVGGSDTDWTIALGRLQEINLVAVKEDESVDCHPLIREYFAVQVKTKDGSAWQAGHKRLYEYLRASTKEGDQPTLEELQPLYQAVAHGCQAGLQQEACNEVYRDRIGRGTEAYAVKKLGAFGTELGAVACFFDPPWNCVSPALTKADQAWLLNQAGFRLRAVGRLTEALEPMRSGLQMRVSQENWRSAAIIASNLSELELTLGDVAGAVRDAQLSVTYADRSGDAFWKMGARTSHADALHQAGRRSEAEVRFREAEQLQAESQPEYPLLYSQQGFIYCDLLLAAPERAGWAGDEKAERRMTNEELLAACRAVSRRASQTLMWAERNKLSLLSTALDYLTLGRAALYEVVLSTDSPSFSLPAAHLSEAVSGLRRAGTHDHIPRGLLTRSWCSFAQAAEHRLRGREQEAVECVNSSQADLDEAWEIASRGPMPLFMADIHFYRARLFGRMKHEGGGMTYPWESPAADLAAARALIEKHGYWRRKEELEDAEAAAGV
jgi:NACHT domain-containing protein